jgi:hypothetical protein
MFFESLTKYNNVFLRRHATLAAPTESVRELQELVVEMKKVIEWREAMLSL